MAIHAGNANEVFLLRMVNSVTIRMDVRATLKPLEFACIDFNATLAKASFSIYYKQVIKVFMRSTTVGEMSDVLLYFPDSRQCFGGNGHWDDWKASHCSIILGYFPDSWNEKADWDKCFSASNEVTPYFSLYSEYFSVDTKFCIALPSYEAIESSRYILEGEIELEGLTSAISQTMVSSAPPYCHDYGLFDQSNLKHSSTYEHSIFYNILVFGVIICFGLILVRAIVLWKLEVQRNRQHLATIGLASHEAYPITELTSHSLTTIELGEQNEEETLFVTTIEMREATSCNTKCEENDESVMADFAAPVATAIENSLPGQEKVSVRGYLLVETLL